MAMIDHSQMDILQEGMLRQMSMGRGGGTVVAVVILLVKMDELHPQLMVLQDICLIAIDPLVANHQLQVI